MAARGHELHLFSYAPPARLPDVEGIEWHEVEVSSYPLFRYPPYEVALASRLGEVAEDVGLDLVHAEAPEVESSDHNPVLATLRLPR